MKENKYGLIQSDDGEVIGVVTMDGRAHDRIIRALMDHYDVNESYSKFNIDIYDNPIDFNIIGGGYIVIDVDEKYSFTIRRTYLY